MGGTDFESEGTFMSPFGRERKEKPDKRFEVVQKESVPGLALGAVKVLRDRRTGVQYLFVTEGYAGGLTPLLDMDGRPIR